MSTVTREAGRSLDTTHVEEPDMRRIVSVEMQDGRLAILYELQEAQNQAFQLTPLDRDPDEPYPKHIGYGGAAGGGKSHLARAVAVCGCFKWPGINALILRQTKDDVKKNHVNNFREEIPDVLPDGTRLYRYNGQDMCATFANGSRLFFGFLKEPDDRLRYQGNEFDIIIFEEATQQQWESVRYLTGERMRATTPQSRPFALYPSNPGGVGHHWYKRLFIEGDYDEELNEKPDDYAFVQAKVEDNKVLMHRDPEYIEKLKTLPEPLRSWRLYGDWDAGEGMALTQIEKGIHLVEPFQVPSYFKMYGAFDWGYSHPFSFGLYAVSEDRRHYKILTLTGRRMLPDEIARVIKKRVRDAGYDPSEMGLIHAGHDCWNKTRARGENTPTIAQVFQNNGLTLTRANTDRIQGLNNLRRYLAWEGMGPEGQNITPHLLFFDNQGNRKAIRQLENLPSDPDRPEDALKQDADEYGRGGDDIYDETRYALAHRRPPPRSAWKDQHVDPWDEDVIKQEAERKMQSNPPRSMRPGGNERDRPVHPELGTVY